MKCFRCNLWPCECKDGITLIHGDCREVLPLLPAVDSVVTDPMYGIGERSGTISEQWQHKNEYRSFVDSLEYVEAVAVPFVVWALENTRTMIVTPGSKALFLYPSPAALGGFYQPAAVGMCSWGRQTFQPILFYGKDPHAGKTIQHTTYQLTEAAEKYGHPCAKPIRAWTWVVGRATAESDLVLDPFVGSGTTLVAAKKLGRRAIGIELEERYCEIAANRLRQEVMAFTD